MTIYYYTVPVKARTYIDEAPIFFRIICSGVNKLPDTFIRARIKPADLEPWDNHNHLGSCCKYESDRYNVLYPTEGYILLSSENQTRITYKSLSADSVRLHRELDLRDLWKDELAWKYIKNIPR